MTTTKNSKSFITGLLTGPAASLCCITPVLAFLGEASGLVSSFLWIEPFRPYLIVPTVLVFAFAWYQKLKQQKQPDCYCETDNKKPFLQSTTFLGIVTVVPGLLIAFLYYAAAFYPKTTQTDSVFSTENDIKVGQFLIKGMTWESCTEHVNHKIAKIKGVIKYQISFEKAESIIKFDNSKISVDSIAAAINNTGYNVTSQKINN